MPGALVAENTTSAAASASCSHSSGIACPPTSCASASARSTLRFAMTIDGGIVIGGVPCGEPGGLAGADDEHAAAAQADGVNRGGHRRRGHGDVTGADRRFAARALAGVQRRLEQPIEQHARGAGLPRQPIRLLDLPEDLHVAEHHRVEPARHAQQVRGHRRPR